MGAERAEPRIVRLEGVRDARSQLIEDAREGLAEAPRYLPARHFYDERGSRLFEDITRLPEYYLTRAETAILARVADDVIAEADPDEIAEIGSGSSRKTRLLLDAVRRRGRGRRYVALDVSEPPLREAGERLAHEEPWLEFVGVVGDFHEHLPDLPRGGRRLVVLLGSTIGNFPTEERRALLGEVAGALATGDRFLVGVDLVKPAETLEAAYDDPAGVTADFNRNLIRVLNRGLGADLDPDDFSHEATWNEAESRVELRLRARRDIRASLPEAGISLRLAAGEGILTEVSCKFTREGFAAELEEAGLVVERWDTDELDRFALVLARAA